MATSGARRGEVPYFRSDDVTRLLQVLQEATRATPHGDQQVYIPPPEGDKANVRYHHLIFGQRGSGKSTLMRYLQRERTAQRQIAPWVDQEIFSGLSYPDVLVSCVEVVMQASADALRASQAARRDEASWWTRWLKRPTTGQKRLVADLDQAAANLRVLKFAQQERRIEWTHSAGSSTTGQRIGTVAIGPAKGRVGFQGDKKSSKSSEYQSTETIESSKGEYLERSLPEFRQLLSSAAEQCGGGYIFFDDVYMLSREDQPRVLGYLHRLVKDSGLWLKIGTIRYLSTTYTTKPTPQGIQEGQDAKGVALDAGLRRLNNSQQFLEQILKTLGDRAEVELDKVFNSQSLNRMALASGCVARDYLEIASESIESARNRPETTKAGFDRVTVEDVNAAARALAPSKMKDLEADAPDEAAELESLVAQLTEFCQKQNSAYFLVNAGDRPLSRQMTALQHLRFAHLIDEDETIPDAGSGKFDVWLLDLSQLSASRGNRTMDFDGWQKREKRRRRTLVFTLQP